MLRSCFRSLYLAPKKFLYRVFLSDCHRISGRPIVRQPTLFAGRGSLSFGEKVKLGFYPSAYFFSGYVHLEPRYEDATIEIGGGTIVNNNTTVIAEHGAIRIGCDCLIGTNVEILNSDFHPIAAELRMAVGANWADVRIGDRVMLANNVKVLKGVTIGEGCLVAPGAIVTADLPPYTLAGGIPARAIREIPRGKDPSALFSLPTDGCE